MFLGTHFPKVDEKGRFFLPAKFRDELGEELVITVGQERCLTLYTRGEFEKQAQAAMSGPSTLKEIRDFQRILASGSFEQEPDKQGRVTIPPVLRAYAGLDKEIAVIGAFNRVEIWDLAAWQAYQTAKAEEFAQMDAEIFPGGLARHQD